MQNLLRLDCCQSPLIDFSKMSLPEIGIDWEDRNLWIALMVVILNPIYWNSVARFNHKTKFLQKLLGSGKRVTIFFAITITLLGMFRTYRFKLVLNSQPTNPLLESELVYYAGCCLIVVGSILVVSSLYVLGFYATYLGDYCGIHLPYRVTTFPYNIFNDPMYVGSSLNYFGLALIFKSDSGIFISLIMSLMYVLASIYEEDFTRKIYETTEGKKRKKKKC